MIDKEFKVVTNDQFVRMRHDVIVIGLTFQQLMVKLRHSDRSWRKK